MPTVLRVRVDMTIEGTIRGRAQAVRARATAIGLSKSVHSEEA